MADAEHSLFSASGSDGWGPCPGKPALEEGRKTTTTFADEGTAAHTLASWVLEDRLEGGAKTAADFLGTKVEVKRPGAKARAFTVSQEMADNVDEYVDRFFLISQARNVERFCEQRVHYHEHLSVPKHLAWGTGDGIAILFDQPKLVWEGRIYPAGDELQLHDLKYGKGVLVEADTMQLKLYGAGALWEYGWMAHIKRVRLVIHQPRKDNLDELVMTVDELLAEVATLRPSVPRVIEAFALAKALREEGSSDLQVGAQLHERGFLAPTDKGCRFCDGKAVCPALAEATAEAVSGRTLTVDDFDDLTVDEPEAVREYGGNYLSAAYVRLEQIKLWMAAIQAEVDRRVLVHGEKLDVCKVALGNRPPMAYVDAGEAEHFARSQPGPIRQLLFKQVLLTPTQASKALKHSPHTWAAMQRLVTRGEPKHTVVPITSKKAAVAHKARVDEFDDLSAELNEQSPVRVGAAGGQASHPFRR